MKVYIRAANRWLAQVLEPGEELDFFCECDEPSCDERTRLTRAQYDELPADGFLVAPGHVARQPDHVPSTDGYALLGDAARVEAPLAQGPPLVLQSRRGRRRLSHRL